MGDPSDQHQQPPADDATQDCTAVSDVPPMAPADDASTTSTQVPPGREWRRAVAHSSRQLSRTMARQAAAVSSTLAPVVRGAGDRMAAASPTTLLLVLLATLVTSSILAALTIEGGVGVTVTVLFIPVLSAAFGATAVRCIEERRQSQEQREHDRQDARARDQIERTLDYVDIKLTTALTQFGTERHNEAVIGMFQAKAATELYLGTASRPEPRPAQQSEPEDVDLVTQYRLAEFLTPPRSVGSQPDSAASRRSSA